MLCHVLSISSLYQTSCFTHKRPVFSVGEIPRQSLLLNIQTCPGKKKTKMLKSLSKFHLFKLHESDTFLPKPPTLSACANLAMNCSRKNLQDGNAVRQRRGVVTHTTRPVYCRYIKTVYEGLQVIEKQKQPKSHP